MINIRGNGRRASKFLYGTTINLAARLQVLTNTCFARACRGITIARNSTMRAACSMKKSLPVASAHFWHHLYIVRSYILRWKLRHGVTTGVVGLIVFIALTFTAEPALQRALGSHFENEQDLATLRTLMVTMGGALIGAAAIVFSIILFAMQINFARMPHGLFRKLSSDVKLLSSYIASFVLAICVAALSLIPDKSWIAVSFLSIAWATIIFLFLFLCGYRRALFLINPNQQLKLIIKNAEHDMQVWTRRARRAAPLFQRQDIPENGPQFRPTHDMPRTLYFQTNPHWTAVSQQAITYAISFAHRYAEAGDHEVSGLALIAVVDINTAYIKAKGKTFFTRHPFLDNPFATDDFINETLEHLRQTIRIGIARGDELQIEQTLQALTALVAVYVTIDYSTDHATKIHANLASKYLSEAVQSVIPHNMPDILMEGVRLMGKSAQLLLANSELQNIVSIVGKIALVGCERIAEENHRPVTRVAMQQLAGLTFDLLHTKKNQIQLVAKGIKKNVNRIVKRFISIPTDAFSISTYLGPYYSLTSDRLANLANEIANADASNENAAAIISNMKEWSEELHFTEKELLLVSIERKSDFTLEIINWITHITKILIVMAQALACNEYMRTALTEHARNLIYVFSWVRDTKEAVDAAECGRMTEMLFEAALYACDRNCSEVYQAARNTLLFWSFKAACHQASGTILERSMCGLATLALWKPDGDELATIMQLIVAALAKDGAPSQEIRDRTARELRREAATLHRRPFELSLIKNSMNQVDTARMSPVLQDIANLLSPNTSNEPVRSGFP